jgi:hypothetical protein
MNKQQSFLLISQDDLDEIKTALNDIKGCISNKNGNKSNTLGGYIREREAQELLNRKTTWFWQKRKSGQLKGKKAGNQWYYKEEDIIGFIKNGSPSSAA